MSACNVNTGAGNADILLQATEQILGKFIGDVIHDDSNPVARYLEDSVKYRDHIEPYNQR